MRLLDDYQIISQELYTNADSKTIQSGLFIHESILEKISYTIRQYSFIEDRNEAGLLERNTSNISPGDIQDIKNIT